MGYSENEEIQPKVKMKAKSTVPERKPRKRTMGEVYVKIDGSITQISRLNVEEFKAFLALTDKIKREFELKLPVYEALKKNKNG